MSEHDLRDHEDEGGDTAPDSERDLEAPDADAAEQHAPLVDTAERHATDASDEVDPADRAEQERVVELDDDEYR